MRVDLSRLAATALDSPVSSWYLEDALDGTGVVLGLAGGSRLIREEIIVKLDDLRLGGRMGVEYFKGRLIGYLAGMGVVTPQNIMYPRSMRLLL